jgi:hypothetical protein
VRFHDFHLAGYTVRRFGSEIVLHLVYDYPEGAKAESFVIAKAVEEIPSENTPST